MLVFQVVCKALSSFTLEDMVAREGFNYCCLVHIQVRIRWF